MKRRPIVLVLILSLSFIVSGYVAPVTTPVAVDAENLDSLTGEGVDCGTLAGATAAAAFLAGWGAVTLLPAIIGYVGLVVFC